MAAAFASNAQAQHKVFLNKGTDNVEAVSLGDDDYIAFSRPEGVPEMKDVEVASTETGKNYVSYKVLTADENKSYVHMLLQKSYVELLTIQQNGSFDENDTKTLLAMFNQLINAGYGFIGQGAQSFTFTDGVKDAAGQTRFIPGGQDFYIVTEGITQMPDGPLLDGDINYVKVTTKEPGVSTETLTVDYKGVNDNSQVWFDVKASENVNTLHMVFGTSATIDQFINTYGYDYLMFTQSNQFTRDQWYTLTDDEHVWSIDKEADFSFYVVGIDKNGDWVKAEIKNQHIKPTVSNDCPVVDVTNKSADNGEVAIKFDVTSKDTEISSAKMLLMKEWDWEDALNEMLGIKEGDGFKYDNPSDAWADYMATTDKAQDVTDVVKVLNNSFTYKKTFTADEGGWYVGVLAVTDKFGTTVTRVTFNPFHGEDESWVINSRTFPVEKTTAKAAKGMAAMSGGVKCVAKRK